MIRPNRDMAFIRHFFCLSLSISSISAHAATFRNYDDEGVMKILCDMGGSLVFKPADNEEDSGEICWQFDAKKVCEKVEVEPFIGNFSVTMVCSAKSAKVEIPVSANYPVFYKYRFEKRKGKLVSLGVKRDEASTEDGNIDYQSGIASLRVGQFEKGFGLLLNANDDGCMNTGCRPTEEVEKEHNLSLAKRIGVEVTKIAATLHKSRETVKLNALYEGYFKFCYDLNLFPKNKEASLVNRLRKDATIDVILPLNDWAFYLWKQKNFLDAQTLLETVLRLDPERAVAYLNLGDTLWDIGKKAEARTAYQEYAKRVSPKKWPKHLKSCLN